MRPSRFTLVGLAAVLVGLVLAVDARAQSGCPRVCDRVRVSTALEPETSCLEVESLVDSCDCSAGAAVTNLCEAPLQAVGFLFDTCESASGSGDFDCESLPVGARGERWVKILAEEPRGVDTRKLTLGGAEGEEPTELTLKIEYGSVFGSGCSAAPGTPGPVGAGLLGVTGALALAGLRRRRGQRY